MFELRNAKELLKQTEPKSDIDYESDTKDTSEDTNYEIKIHHRLAGMKPLESTNVAR